MAAVQLVDVPVPTRTRTTSLHRRPDRAAAALPVQAVRWLVAARAHRAVDLAWNVALLGALWVAYALVRGVTADQVPEAMANAGRVLEAQRALGLPDEAWLQGQVLGLDWLVRAANRFYLYVHFPGTVLALGWAWARRRALFGRLRTALITVTTAGLVLHVAFPLAPPRMLPGFVDTGAVFGPSPYDLEAASAANQIAAMPSLHVGWALLVALAVVAAGRRPWRWLAVAHPVVTTAVVVVTANHYWSDAIVAAVLVAAGWWFAGRRAALAASPTGPDTTGPAVAVPTSSFQPGWDPSREEADVEVALAA